MTCAMEMTNIYFLKLFNFSTKKDVMFKVHFKALFYATIRFLATMYVCKHQCCNIE